MCVIYQLNFTVFMYVTRKSCYITLYTVFGIIRGRSCNKLPTDTAVRLYILFNFKTVQPKRYVIMCQF